MSYYTVDKVIAASLAYPIVRQEAERISRRLGLVGPMEPSQRKALEQQLEALRDRQADLLAVITEQDF